MKNANGLKTATSEVSLHFLKSQAYMGHTVQTEKGQKLTWQALSSMEEKEGYSATKRVKYGQHPTESHNTIYTVID